MARYVTGLDAVLQRITRELMAVKGRTYIGMMEAMKFLEEQMDTVNPVVPISNKKNKVHMRETWFIQGNNHPTNPIVFAGYTADYAPIVHENVTAVNWTRAGSGPKWLQIHYDRDRRDMFLIVAANARVSRTRAGSAAKTSGTVFTHISKRTNQRNVEF